MSRSAIDYLHGISGKPYIAQFVMSLAIEGSDQTVTQINTYLIPAASEREAREAALGMIDSLSDSYRNSDGKPVHVRCVGIHRLEELDYVDDDGRLQLGTFRFSNSTLPTHLVLENEMRDDLPKIE